MTISMKNGFKAELAAGAQQIGCWLGLASPYTAEIMAGAGFDWLLIDGEHAPNSIPSILAQLQVLAAYPVHAVVRPSVNDPVQIKQLLDLGAQTLLIPMVETAEQARQAVAAVRYPPYGIRGVGSALARGSRWSRHTDYLKQSDREMCVLVQLESARGLQELDQILAVEGVDGVFIGPADLSAALGHLGNPGHPDVQHAIDRQPGSGASLPDAGRALCRGRGRRHLACAQRRSAGAAVQASRAAGTQARWRLLIFY